jgi:replicative DNA helicase
LDPRGSPHAGPDLSAAVHRRLPEADAHRDQVQGPPAQAQQDLWLVVVDYVQLLDYGRRRFASRYEEINEITRHPKLLARELQVPVVAMSQLNRGPE